MNSLKANVDENGLIHSHNDEPINMGGGYYHWLCHGFLHRENDKPAVNHVDENGYTIHQEWYIKDILHRETGPNPYYANVKDNDSFYLFDYQIDAEQFHRIVDTAAFHRVPVWVAWLLEFKLISVSYLEAFYDEDGMWTSSLPYSWILKTWGINAEAYNKVFNSSSYVAVFANFLAVVEHQSSLSQKLN